MFYFFKLPQSQIQVYMLVLIQFNAISKPLGPFSFCRDMADASIQPNGTTFTLVCVMTLTVVGGVAYIFYCVVAAPTMNDSDGNSTTVVSPAQPRYDPQNVEYYW